MTLHGKRALVTGGGGFIGSHLAEALARAGTRTRSLVRYTSTGSAGWLEQSPLRGDIEVLPGDVRDADTLRRAVRGVDVVFHLAALIGVPYSYQAPLSYVRTNVEGTLHVLEAALREEVSLVVHTSTSEVYGSAREVPMGEDHPLRGQSPYSASKIGADHLAEAFHRSFGLPVVTVRPFNTYGPRQSARAVVPAVISQVLAGGEVRLGNLEPTRDFNYVGDTVEGFLKAASTEEASGEVVNLGSGVETSIAQLARTVARLAGRGLTIVGDDRRQRPDASEVDRLVADNGKARRLLGWQPRVPLEEGLRLTLDWFRENPGGSSYSV